jgi:hypothetical protein
MNSMLDFRRKMKQDGLSVVTRDEIFATMELTYQDMKPLIWSVQIFPKAAAIVANQINQDISTTVYMSETISVGDYFTVTYFEMDKVPFAVCISETNADIGHFVDQFKQKYPHKVSFVVPCKYANLFPTAKIDHNSIFNHFAADIKLNYPKSKQKHLLEKLTELHNCETVGDISLEDKLLSDACSRYQMSMKYDFQFPKLDGSLPFDCLLLSVYYSLFTKESIEFKTTPSSSFKNRKYSEFNFSMERFATVHEDLHAVKTGIDWLDLSIIEDSIIGLINEHKKADRFHLISLFRDDFASTVATISTVPSGKILLRILHTGNGTHWVLGIVHVGKKRAIILDSKRDPDGQRLECFRLLYTIGCIYSMTTLSSKGENVGEWDFHYSSDCPQQLNDTDCGVFYVKSILSKSKLEPPPSPRHGRDFIANLIQSIPVRPLIQAQLEPNDRLVELYADNETLITKQHKNINIITESVESKLYQL